MRENCSLDASNPTPGVSITATCSSGAQPSQGLLAQKLFAIFWAEMRKFAEKDRSTHLGSSKNAKAKTSAMLSRGAQAGRMLNEQIYQCCASLLIAFEEQNAKFATLARLCNFWKV